LNWPAAHKLEILHRYSFEKPFYRHSSMNSYFGDTVGLSEPRLWKTQL
jgi:hypothetical protein